MVINYDGKYDNDIDDEDDDKKNNDEYDDDGEVFFKNVFL